MNDTDHVFLLPAREQEKLDELRREIAHPVAARTRRFLAANAWTAIVIAVAAGLVCGLARRRRG